MRFLGAVLLVFAFALTPAGAQTTPAKSKPAHVKKNKVKIHKQKHKAKSHSPAN